MTQWFGAWGSRRMAITLGLVSNVIGALAAAGAAVTAWISIAWQSDLALWSLVMAGIGGVFVAKGVIILALAEGQRTLPADDEPDLRKALAGLENRLSGRQKALVERVERLEDEVAHLRTRA